MSLVRLCSVLAAVVVLAGCTADRQSSQELPTETGPSSLEPSDAAPADPQQVIRIQVPGYPQQGSLPKRLPVDDATVRTRLDCDAGDRHPAGIPFKWDMMNRALPEIATALTQKLRGAGAVIVMQTKRTASVLILDKSDSPLGHWSLYRYGDGWTWDSMRYCDGKNEAIVIT